MLGRTGRREGTRQGEQRHLLALEEFAGLYRLRALVGHHVERDIGDAVANLDGHGFLVWSDCERSGCICAAAAAPVRWSAPATQARRSEERSVGKECGSRGRARWSPDP